MAHPNRDGPYETEQQVRELLAVQDIYRAFSADPGAGKMAAHTRRMLIEACEAAGTGFGTYDRRVLSWLAGFTPETAAVICGLIGRAHDAGFADGETAHPGRVMPGGGWISGPCQP